MLEHTVLAPQGADALIASLLVALSARTPVSLNGPDGQQIELPSELVDLLRDVVDAMAHGQAVTVAPLNTLLTTQQAAELLGISRPTLIKLLEAGEIPFLQPGRHRRIELTDLLAYRDRIRTNRRAVLSQMTAEAAEDDLHVTVNGFVATR